MADGRVRLNIRCAHHEMAAWRAAATVDGKSLTAWVRDGLNGSLSIRERSAHSWPTTLAIDECTNCGGVLHTIDADINDQRAPCICGGRLGAEWVGRKG